MNITAEQQDILPSLPNFCNEWRRLSDSVFHSDNLATRLSVFIDEWKANGWNTELPTQGREIDVAQFEHFISIAVPVVSAIKDARRSGETANVWKVAGLKRDEVRVSSVFAWFLNQHSEHGQGYSLLSGLINRINFLYPNRTDFPLSEHIDGKPYSVNVESCPLGERESRVDIEVEGDRFLMFIEVKIDAPETNNQIQRYLDIGKNKSNGRPWCVVFLSPTGRKPAKSLVHSQLLTIAWKDVGYVFRKHANALDKCYAKSMIHQFAKFISDF